MRRWVILVIINSTEKNKNDLPPATKLYETSMNRIFKLVADDFLSGFICYNYGYLLPVLNEF